MARSVSPSGALPDRPVITNCAPEQPISVASEVHDALDMVNKVVTGPGVEWTMTPAATMKFARFMRRVGTTKREPASWKDLFFPEIGGLNGS